MKRVNDFGADYVDEGEFGNYVSFTIWQDKDCFDVWRTGDAFKEAHGGGGLTDFIQLLSTEIRDLWGTWRVPMSRLVKLLYPKGDSEAAGYAVSLRGPTNGGL